MRSVPRWSPKLKSGKQPGKDEIVECKEQLPLNQLACRVAVGGLILIGITSAILAISGTTPKKSVARRLDTGELNAQNRRLDGIDVGAKPTNLAPPAPSTSGYPFSIPTQGIVSTALPGSLYQTPPLTRKPALERFGAESGARERFQHPSVVSRRPRSAPAKKRKWSKTFIMYLEAHQDFLRKILGTSQIASSKTRE
jgi:hypothetical protein